MAIPTSANWLATTELKFKIRSGALRKVDAAIAAYERTPGPGPEQAIRTAFVAWKQEKGADWAKSERNQAPSYPMTKLDEALHKDLGLSQAEKDALDFWKTQRAQNLQRVFADASINLRLFSGAASVLQCKADLQNAVNQIKSAAGSVASRGAEAAANAAFSSQISEIRAALSDVFGVPITDVMHFGQTVLADTGLTGMVAVADHIAGMLPLISVISGGVKTLAAGGMAVKAVYDRVSFSGHEAAFESGNPAAAFEAVQRLLTREAANASAKAGIEATAFAANTALHAAKGVGAALAPVVAAAKATANAVRVITKFAIECRETLIARKALKDPKKLDLRIFDKCPLLGAYMLVGSDTSDLVAMLFDEFGQAGWMQNVESLYTSHIGKALDKCADLIQSSPFIVKGVPAHRKITSGATLRAAVFKLA